MHFSKDPDSPSRRTPQMCTRFQRERHWVRIATCLALTAALTGVAQNSMPNPDRSIHDPVLTTPPDANAQMQMRDQQAKQQSFEAANIERKKQIVDDSTKLLKLATDLKAEVDKTDKDTLSLNVIRKAEEIEKLAHNVREKMKLTVGTS
jgi:hypothetical protein